MFRSASSSSSYDENDVQRIHSKLTKRQPESIPNQQNFYHENDFEKHELTKSQEDCISQQIFEQN